MMLSIHASPPLVGQIFVAIASDESGAGIYKCVAAGQYLELGEDKPTSDKAIMLEGAAWCPLFCVPVDEAFIEKEQQDD